MRFVPVDGTTARFSIWETREHDFFRFSASTDREHPTPQHYSPEMTQPAVMVSWDDAVAFCEWLTMKEREQGIIGENQWYRLPTDAEWSAAVGLDSETVFPWGSNWPPPPLAGNFQSEEVSSDARSIKGYFDGYEFSAPVGSFPANRYGLYDMSGNVWEWCQDHAPSENRKKRLRGGAFSSFDSSYLHSSKELIFTPEPEETLRFNDVGFRCVLAE